jgi:predicted nuclease of predicted toxin-antitoxin system
LKSITRTDCKNEILSDVLYIVDQDSKRCIGTRPEKYFIELSDVLPLDMEDYMVLHYAKKTNLTIITGDLKFVLENLIESKNVIFQKNDGTRTYFKSKSSLKISSTKTNIIKKIVHTIQRKKQYITDNDGFVQKFSKLPLVYAGKVIPKLDSQKKTTRHQSIVQYAEKNNLIIITDSKYLCINSLLQCKKCIFRTQDDELHHIFIEDFIFEKVRKKHNQSIESHKFQIRDPLQNNIRFIRDYITVIEKNLNFMECELLRRKELEASSQLEPLQVPIKQTTSKGAYCFE